MSIRNVDRHGLENLKHDPVKALDRLKIPPYLLYALFMASFFYMSAIYFENEELQFDSLTRKNILLAMKKNQDKIEYGDDEISPAEEL
jgi:hypothetical protein